MGYSQNNEEDIILKFFNGQIGWFLDIGVNDGKTLSNTFALLMNGWSGVSVEASKKAFEILSENYKDYSDKVEWYNVAITDNKEGEIIFYESGTHLDGSDVSLLSTIHEHELVRWQGSKNEFNKITATAIPFKKFYSKLKNKQYDFISIDIEGEDLNVLREMDLSFMETKLVCLEHNSNSQIKNEMIEYCYLHGLKNILLENAENIIISI